MSSALVFGWYVVAAAATTAVFCLRRLLAASVSRRADFTGDEPAAAAAGVVAGTALPLRFRPGVAATAAATAAVLRLYRAASAAEISAYNTTQLNLLMLSSPHNIFIC